MAVSRRTSRSRYTLILLILTSVTIITLDVRGFGPVETARGAVMTVFAPVGDFASGVFRPVGDAWSGAFEGADLKQQNDELRRQVEDLNGQIAQGQAAQSDLDKLRAATQLSFEPNAEKLTAEVTLGAIANFDDTIEINRGTDDGVAKGMPVVLGTGLVGSVTEVTGGRAKVRLVTERGFRAGVAVQGVPGTGVIEGQGEGQNLQVTGFDVETPLAPGQLLQTAGTVGSLFPPGIPVATIESVTVDDTTKQKTASVKLVSTIENLAYVSVLLYRVG